MNIAVVAPLVAPVVHGAPQIGGAQALLADLCRVLADKEHQVQLIAPAGSGVPGVATVDLGLDAALFAPASFAPEAPQLDVGEQTHAFRLIASWLGEHATQLSLVHGHAYDAPAFSAFGRLSLPVAHTLHLPPIHQPVVEAVRSVARTAALVTVSKHNQGLWWEQGVDVPHVIPNGVDIDGMPFGERSDGYLLFAGRIAPEKGPQLAIAAAGEAGLPLLLVGGVYDGGFYRSHVAPLLRSEPDWRPGNSLPAAATYIGPRSRPDVWQLMSRALAVLMPAEWDEPFGLVAIEAQATGCPVVAFARGGLPEVIEDGISGCLSPPGDVQALAAAIRRAAGLSRRACREWVRQRHSLGKMVEAYERLDEEIGG
ncbi:MAG: glycosyltransferase [Chloroflexota bacterium]|nr:glycosyltransferase [Chloroflexota bacterium]